MNKKAAIIGAFLVGVVIASAVAHFYYAQQIQKASLIEGYYYEGLLRQGVIHDSIRLLIHLRSAELTNVVERCESKIDWAVIGLAWFANDIQTNKIVPAKEKVLLYKDVLKGIQDAKKYRDRFPYKSGNFTNDNEVSNVFILVNVQTNL